MARSIPLLTAQLICEDISPNQTVRMVVHREISAAPPRQNREPGACVSMHFTPELPPSSVRDFVTTCLHNKDKERQLFDYEHNLSHNLLSKMCPHIRGWGSCYDHCKAIMTQENRMSSSDLQNCSLILPRAM